MIALVPAAGRSERMGRPKLLLPLGDRLVIERLVDAAHSGGVSEILVIVRPDDDELSDIASRAGATVIRLPYPTPDMRATVLAGLDWIESHRSIPRGFFLVPADHPTLSADIFRELPIDRASIVVPTHAGRCGHPVWIAWNHISGLRAVPEGTGLNSYLRLHPALEVTWPTSDILLDLDTPADYEHLRSNVFNDVAARLSLTLVTANGEFHESPPHRPRIVLPGSFHPLHAGHLGMAAAAREILGEAVAFELSRQNVDKPELPDEEIARRVKQFRGVGDLWVTRAARFVDKSTLFPGATFVVGADTAARFLDARYYEGDTDRLAGSLDRLARNGGRLLVAARIDGAGVLRTLDDLDVPPRWRGLFTSIPASRFRLDISSTELRREGRP